jgi:hypothetical protein
MGSSESRHYGEVGDYSGDCRMLFASGRHILADSFHPPKQWAIDRHFESLANETLHKWHVPGIAIAVVDGDQMWAAVG